jgi:Inner membrane component of T3SS, cytoplasmic domain/Domain of unknown function (DUF4145)
MDRTFQELIERLNHLSGEFDELRSGVLRAIRIADDDTEMALTRARKVLEYMVREVYERRVEEPPGTRPLENLLQRPVKDGHFPGRLSAYANTVRMLGNVGTHNFGERISAGDVYQSLTQLMPVLEWYFEVERPAGSHPKPAGVAEQDITATDFGKVIAGDALPHLGGLNPQNLNPPIAPLYKVVITNRQGTWTVPLGRTRITFGRGMDCDIVLGDPYLSRTSIALDWDQSQKTFSLLNLTTRIPVSLNVNSVIGPRDLVHLSPGDRISIGTTLIVFLENRD